MASFFDQNILKADDLKRINELNAAWLATDDKNKREQFHTEAETIRNSYGYSGGGDGSEFIPISTGVYTAATSVNDYTDALREAESKKQKAYESQLKQADVDNAERLRQAYIKNMQSKLGLDQTMKASGITGGATESTLASIDNNYNVLRDSIYSDTDEIKRDIMQQSALSQSESDSEIASVLYDSALDRADRLERKSDSDYQKEQDALKHALALEQFDYQKEQDAILNNFKQYDRDYQAEQDKLDREYQAQRDAYEAQQDAYDRAQAAKNAAKSANKNQISNVLTLIKNGYYSDSFADILGVDDLQFTGNNAEDAQSAVWKMLANGVYHDSFPEIVGFPDNVLKEYADNVKYGY